MRKNNGGGGDSVTKKKKKKKKGRSKKPSQKKKTEATLHTTRRNKKPNRNATAEGENTELEANQTKFRDNSERKARKKTLGQSKPKQTEKNKETKEQAAK